MKTFIKNKISRRENLAKKNAFYIAKKKHRRKKEKKFTMELGQLFVLNESGTRNKLRILSKTKRI